MKRLFLAATLLATIACSDNEASDATVATSPDTIQPSETTTVSATTTIDPASSSTTSGTSAQH